MVIIQPFEYEKTTAFKERVQIANKVNEIIDLFNELDIESKINIFNEEIEIINGKIAEIDSKIVEVDNAVAVVEGYNTRLTSVENESVSLDARLDNLEPRVTATENKNNEQDTQISSIVSNVTNLTNRVTISENNITELTNKDLQNVKLNIDQTINSTKYIKKIESTQNVLGNGVSIDGFNTSLHPTGWYKIYQISNNLSRCFINIEIMAWSNNSYSNGVANLYIWKLNAGDQVISRIKQFGQTFDVRITQDTNYITVWVFNPVYRYCGIEVKRANTFSTLYVDIVSIIYDGSMLPEPTIDDYTYITTPTVIN